LILSVPDEVCVVRTKFDIYVLLVIFLNATFSNISVISWLPVLMVEEATGKLYHLRLRVECTLFCNLQSGARTHAVWVIGLYKLLGNPTT